MENNNKTLSKEESARDYVNGHTATAVAVVLATALVPGAATVVLTGQEAIMAYQIGRIYKGHFTATEGAAIASSIGLAAVAGQIVALEAAILLGPFAFIAKPAIAAGIVKALGELIIDYFEKDSARGDGL